MTDERSTLPEKPPVDALPFIEVSEGQEKRPGVVSYRQMELIDGAIVLKPDRTQVAAEEVPLDIIEEEVTEMETSGKWIPKERSKQEALSRDTYVRITVRVQNGEMSVVDSAQIEGKLAMPSNLGGNFVYEVTRGQERIYIDSIPDIGTKRSFADPNAPSERRREHIIELDSYEFNVLVPEEALTLEALQDLDITLYRAKEPLKMDIRPEPTEIQFERELRKVAHLRGIPYESLPPKVQSAMEAKSLVQKPN